MNDHEHAWCKTDLIVSVSEPYDGPGYLWPRLHICSVCGILRPRNWEQYVGEPVVPAQPAPKEGP